ncbi:coiled-coil domain-containing protein 125 [Aplysia californica]|uniref:Coiled-coil domain-containing protein 125 n=1 Tax=Aplysia californica TaxID=6500 RepID=A0ABM1VX47_APLCA|nr:coiled-coil domain-containing protein 125 [Aplysia californica]
MLGQYTGQTWEAELYRVCQENATLMSKLEARNEELRRANAHKTALARERDELLALLDVTERLKYEQGKSRVAEEEYGTFTSSELAVLGACKCRVSNPDPCGCAHAAANLRKEVSKLKEEVDLNQRRREEANLTVDAYRMAFEEQLSKSRGMSQRLAHVASLTSRSSKAKAAIKFLIEVLNDDDYTPATSLDSVSLEDLRSGAASSMSLQEMVSVLSDMVYEKKEALAHQKLATQLIANKLYLLENRFADCDSSPGDDVRKTNSSSINQVQSSHNTVENILKNYSKEASNIIENNKDTHIETEVSLHDSLSESYAQDNESNVEEGDEVQPHQSVLSKDFSASDNNNGDSGVDIASVDASLHAEHNDHKD